MFTVSIVGRPNVGKSTIFNSLVGKKSAIVYDMPGVTRDRKEAIAKISDLRFKLIDTAGFEGYKGNVLEKDIAKQIDLAVEAADLLLLVFDAKDGLVTLDHEFISYLRKKSKDLVLIVNKSEIRKKNITNNDIYRTGFDEVIYLSAEHRIGYDELYAQLSAHYFKYQKIYADLLKEDTKDKAIKITIIGKPNVGKSTLINSFLDEDRLITCDESGTTRDSIEISWHYKKQKITLIDTAGIRKRTRVKEKIEKLSYEDSLKAVRFSEVCVLLFDATQNKLERQDVNIASHVIDEGRALIIVLNKIDLLSKEELIKTKEEIQYQIGKYVPQNKELKILTISAKQKINIFSVIEDVLQVYKNWNLRIATNTLNRWLKYVINEHRPPLYRGKELRLKYITQIKSRPPTFVVTANYPDKISDSYIRYLKKSLVESFNFSGVNPRLIFKKTSNPYIDKKPLRTEKK